MLEPDDKSLGGNDNVKRGLFAEYDDESTLAALNEEASRTSRIAAFRKWLSENPHSRFLIFASVAIVVLAIFVFLMFGTAHSDADLPEDAKSGWTRGSGGGRPAYEAAPVASRSARGSSAKILSTTVTERALTRDFVVPTLIERVLTRSFEVTDEVATGRFYSDFSEQSAALEKVVISALRPLRRGNDWILVEAPYLEKPDWAPTDYYTEVAGVARLRLVRSEGEWKVENVKLFPRMRDSGQQIQDAWEAQQDLDFFAAWQASESLPPEESP